MSRLTVKVAKRADLRENHFASDLALRRPFRPTQDLAYEHMFRTVANFFHSVGDVLDDMLVGDAEFEAAQYANQPCDCPTFGDSRVRLLWDAAAQDRSYAGAMATLERPSAPSWDAGDDFAWEDGKPVCPAEGRWRAAVMRFEALPRRDGAVPAPAIECQ